MNRLPRACGDRTENCAVTVAKTRPRARRSVAGLLLALMVWAAAGTSLARADATTARAHARPRRAGQWRSCPCGRCSTVTRRWRARVSASTPSRQREERQARSTRRPASAEHRGRAAHQRLRHRAAGVRPAPAHVHRRGERRAGGRTDPARLSERPGAWLPLRDGRARHPGDLAHRALAARRAGPSIGSCQGDRLPRARHPALGRRSRPARHRPLVRRRHVPRARAPATSLAPSPGCWDRSGAESPCASGPPPRARPAPPRTVDDRGHRVRRRDAERVVRRT